ncbi:MAG: peptide ABC transporter substrate-binding protein, partial [Chloroflexota bacterium]|nr:peptide ABC transporter substrate-binding protein [Chloroflexota bacterium]
MRPSKKFTIKLLPAFLALMAMLMVACGGSTAPTGTNLPKAAPAAQQIYRYPIADTDIPSFDPGQATDIESITAINAVFTGLVTLDDQLKVQDQLAASHSMSSDGLTYTFKLRPNLKFSDGSPLQAQDVIYSIDRALTPEISKLNGVSLTYLGLIKDSTGRTTGAVKSLINDSLMAPTPDTVVIKLSKAAGYFLQALTYPSAFVVEKKVIDQWGLKWIDHFADNGGQGGAGPFIVSKYDHSTGIDLVPNKNYYGPIPKLQKFQILFYKAVKTEYEAYQANQVDQTAVPSANYAQAKLSKEFSQTSELTIFYLAMNYLAKPFDNIKIRQAMELAINKDLMIKSVWKGRYTPTCHIVPDGMPGYNPNLKCPMGVSTAGSPDLAKQLFTQGLGEAGYTLANFPPIKLTYAIGSSDVDNEFTTLKQMWQTVLGINVTLAPVQYATYLTESANTLGKSDKNGGLQMWSAGWGADYPDPQDWLTLQFGDNQSYNQYNYGNNQSATASAQQADQQLMDAADGKTDQASRLADYNKAEQSIVDNVGW